MPAGGHKPNIDHKKVAMLLAMRQAQVADACQLWPGKVDRKGYGRLHFRGRSRLAHDAMWEVVNGAPLAPELTLDHYRMNSGTEGCSKACVNLFHLEPVSNVENVMRGHGDCAEHARQTHCKRGHEFTKENLRPRKDGNRECRRCYLDSLAQRRTGGSNGEKTECKWGHPFDGMNTIWRVYPDDRTRRVCRACRDAANEFHNSRRRRR